MIYAIFIVVCLNTMCLCIIKSMFDNIKKDIRDIDHTTHYLRNQFESKKCRGD